MNVIEMKLNESAVLDSTQLANLFIELGEAGAQNVVCRAMEELAVRLSVVNEAYKAKEFDILRKGSKALVGIAEQVGMAGLADAARNVHHCVQTHDMTALAATVSRLLRIGDCSLTEVWDLQDLSV